MEITQLPLFDYTALDADTRDFVQQRTGEIKALAKRAADDIITIGKALVEVKERLGHGQFGQWLEAEFRWSDRTARGFMSVTEKFAGKSEIISDFAPTVLYALAAPSTPDAAITEAIELLQSGDKVTVKKAKEIIRKHREPEEAAAIELIIDTAPGGKIANAIDASHIKAVIDVADTLMHTGAVESPSYETEDRVMVTLADALKPAVIQANYEAVKRQETYIEQKREKKQQLQLVERTESAATLPALSDFVQGDCREILPTLQPKSVRLLLTDPPYGIAFQSNHRVVSPKAPRITGDSSLDEALMLSHEMLETIEPAMKDDCHILMFTGWRYEPQFRELLQDAGYEICGSLVWVKENHGSGDLGLFAPKHERIIHARKGNATITPRLPDVLMAARGSDTDHPTEKPVDLLKQLISCTTIEGELIVDPFAGTGSTVSAARQLNRRILGIELEQTWHNQGTIRLTAA